MSHNVLVFLCDLNKAIVNCFLHYYSQHLKHKNVALIGLEETDFAKAISPPEDSSVTHASVLHVFKGADGTVWVNLQTLDQLILVIKQYQSQKEKIHLVVGNTASGIQIFHDEIVKQTVNLHINDIPELLGIRFKERAGQLVTCRRNPGAEPRSSASLVVGSAEKIQSLYEYIIKMCSSSVHEDKCSTFPPSVLREHMMRLATTEVRNAGSLGGNLYLAKKWGSHQIWSAY